MITADVIVVGAGVFGAWTAYQLAREGSSVVLVDPFGPGHSRSSSGGETRILRMGYGPDEIYTRWARSSLAAWQELTERSGDPLLHRVGVLWIAAAGDPHLEGTAYTLRALGIPLERLTGDELRRRYPQVALPEIMCACFEPESGVILARRAVQRVVQETVALGGRVVREVVLPPVARGSTLQLETSHGEALSAAQYVFACGAWLPRLFPALLGRRIHPTRQEVFFFGTPAGDARYAPPAMPALIDFGAQVYSVPDLDGRGLKLALDRHGPDFDPETGDRVAVLDTAAQVRRVLENRFPGLAGAPLVEARVCQYENTSNGDFLIDRHPDWPNVWLVGGGSGHGFKHGPAVGAYVRDRLRATGVVEPRFSLESKTADRRRAVY